MQRTVVNMFENELSCAWATMTYEHFENDFSGSQKVTPRSFARGSSGWTSGKGSSLRGWSPEEGPQGTAHSTKPASVQGAYG